MELRDAYDAGLKKIKNVTLVRGEPIPRGLYHLVSEVLVRHAGGTYLLMRRDPRKHFGNMWEASAGELRAMSPPELVTHRIQQFIEELR